LIAVPADATPEQIAAAQKKAEDLRKQAAKGKDFAELARQYSDDDSKSKGGELGDFGPNDLNDQIAAAVKNLKAGEISAVVHTKYGFHIVKVEQHQTPGAMPLDQAKAAIRDKLTTEQAKVGFQKWIDQDLTSQHYVETMN
jgi:parvulin-like peptidyl-prolyl isomerase